MDLIYYVYHICYDLLGRIEESAFNDSSSLQGAEFCPQLDDDIGDDAEDDGNDDHDNDDDGDDDDGDDNHDSTAAEFSSWVPTCAASLML